MSNQELKNIIDGKIIALVMNIVVIILAIFLLEQEKLALDQKQTISKETTQTILLISRFISLGIILYFLYVNYRLYQEYQHNPKYRRKTVLDQMHQLESNLLVLGSILIELYVVLTNYPVSAQVEETEIGDVAF